MKIEELVEHLVNKCEDFEKRISVLEDEKRERDENLETIADQSFREAGRS